MGSITEHKRLLPSFSAKFELPTCSWRRTGPRCEAPAELAEQGGVLIHSHLLHHTSRFYAACVCVKSALHGLFAYQVYLHFQARTHDSRASLERSDCVKKSVRSKSFFCLVDQFPQYPEQSFRFNRFTQMSIHTRLKRKLHILVECAGSQCDDRDPLCI